MDKDEGSKRMTRSRWLHTWNFFNFNFWLLFAAFSMVQNCVGLIKEVIIFVFNILRAVWDQFCIKKSTFFLIFWSYSVFCSIILSISQNVFTTEFGWFWHVLKRNKNLGLHSVGFLGCFL